VNNCVGLANHKFFLLFLLYTFSICAYALCLLGAHVWACLSPAAPQSCFAVTPGAFISTLILTICAMLFGLFTLCMMVDQSQVLATGLTQIDRHKGHAGPTGKLAALAAAETPEEASCRTRAEVFGGDGRFQLSWSRLLLAAAHAHSVQGPRDAHGLLLQGHAAASEQRGDGGPAALRAQAPETTNGQESAASIL
jgi:hypothetical protein